MRTKGKSFGVCVPAGPRIATIKNRVGAKEGETRRAGVDACVSAPSRTGDYGKTTPCKWVLVAHYLDGH
jgi:hypothetical protein